MSWLERLLPSKIRTDTTTKKEIPQGVWTKCEACQAVLYCEAFTKNLNVCLKCNHHGYFSAKDRLTYLFNSDSYETIGEDLRPTDQLKFKDLKKYKDRLTQAETDANTSEALLVMQGKLINLSIVACAFEFKFMAGSMGAVVGERFVQGLQIAYQKRLPFICFATSGGARMQEALVSLMQMAKTSIMLAKFARAHLPYITVLVNPTMGGVSASLAMLGDIILAEPNALIGFAGPRVIEQTVRVALPEGFQRSEFLLAHGAIDAIVDRRQMRQTLHRLLTKMMHVNK